MRVADFVIEDIGAVDGLIEIPAQILAGNFLDRFQEILARGMREAIAHEIGVQGVAQGVFADHFFQRDQHGGRLAVGDVAVGIAVDELPGEARDRIHVRFAEVGNALQFGLAHVREGKIHDGSFLAVERVHYFHFGVAVDAFVEPSVFEFVGGDHAVPILVAEFVFGDDFGSEQAVRHPPRGACRNQCGIFHAAGVTATVRRVYHRDAVVRIRPVPLIEELQSSFQRFDVARRRRHVTGRHQQVNFYGAVAAGPGIFDVREARARGPGKIVNVFGVEREGLGAVRIIDAGNLIAARADDFILRQRDFHVEGAEVGEEFRGGVKLVAVPGVFPPHADFREPLADHIEIVGVAGAFDDFGKLVVESHAKRDGSAGSDRLRQGHLKYGVVIRVVVIRLDEFHLGGQVAHAFDFEFIHVYRAVMFWIPFGIGAIAARAGEANFGHESGLRLEGVEVEVEGKSLLRLAGQVVVRQSLGGGDGVLRGVELGVNFVGHHASGKRLLRGVAGFGRGLRFGFFCGGLAKTGSADCQRNYGAHQHSC